MPPAPNGVTATWPYLSKAYGPKRAANVGIMVGMLAKSNLALVESSGNTFSKMGITGPEGVLCDHCQNFATVIATRYVAMGCVSCQWYTFVPGGPGVTETRTPLETHTFVSGTVAYTSRVALSLGRS